MTKQLQEPGLPEDVLARMHRLAETRTMGSRPFPAMDRAIRRDRVSRFGAVAAATAMVAVVATGVAVGDGLGQSEAAPASTTSAPEDAGYPSNTSGSLAGDTEWLDALRQRMVKEEGATAAKDVRVVAAGDVEDRARYALVLYPTGNADWVQQFWFGLPGDQPAAMSSNGSATSQNSVPNDSEVIFSIDGDLRDVMKDGKTPAPLVFVSAPGGRSASLLSTRRVEADGSITEERRDLPAVADGIWAAPISDGEFVLADAEVDGEPIGTVTGGGDSLLPGHEFDFVSVAPAGTTGDDLSGAELALQLHVQPSIDDVPVFAASSAPGTDPSGSVTLMQAPSGAYLFGLADAHIAAGSGNGYGNTEWSGDGNGTTTWTAGGTIPAGAEPGEVIAAMRTTHKGEEQATNTYVVLAPEDATQVRVGGTTADVRNRVGVVEVPVGEDTGKPLPVQALDSKGEVIGETTPVESD